MAENAEPRSQARAGRPVLVWIIAGCGVWAGGLGLIFWALTLFGVIPMGSPEQSILLPGIGLPDHAIGIGTGILQLAATAQLFRLSKSAVFLWAAVCIAAVTMSGATLASWDPSAPVGDSVLLLVPPIASTAVSVAIVWYCLNLSRRGVLV